MLKNTLINRTIIRKIACALGELNDRVVYVGGAVVSLYINDLAADDVRPTQDIDFSMEIANLAELELIREKLIQKGFYQTSEDTVICRFRFEDIKVDVMATRAVGWASANPWFEPGFKHLISSVYFLFNSVRWNLQSSFIALIHSWFSNNHTRVCLKLNHGGFI